MKKLAILIFLGVLTAVGAAAQATMFVAVESAPVRASNGLLARTQGELAFGDQVVLLRESGRWSEVRAAGTNLTGWVESNALTSRRITGSRTSAAATEIALAGKGFSEETERDYMMENDVDFSDVDAMETQRVSNEELHSFLSEGRLSI